MVPASILRLLNRLRWRDRWLGLARGLGWGVALVVAVVVLVCFVDWLVDRFVDTPAWLRVVLSLLPVLAIGFSGYLTVAPLLKRFRDDDLALWIERRVPLGQRLIAAVQLNRETADVRGMSPALIAAVTRRAEQDAESVELSRVCDDSRLKRGLYAAMPTLLVAVLLLAFAPATMAALLARLFGKDVDVPRSVHFQPTGRDVWPANEEGLIRVRVTRGHPGERARGSALIRPQTGRSFSVPLTYESEDDEGVVYSGKVPPSDVPFTFRAWLSDGRLRQPAAIRYAPRPVATSVRSWVLLPEDKVGKRQDGSPYSEAMKGADLFYRLPDAKGLVLVTAQVPLTQAWLEVIDADHQSRRVDMTVESEAAIGSFAFRPGDAAYEVHMIDENGFECVDRPRRLIRRMPLPPPEVTLLPETMYREGDPGTPDEREIEGIPIVRTDDPKQGRRFNVKYRCEARYGVKRAQLRFRVIRAGKDADADSGKIDRDDFLTLPLGPPRNQKGPPTAKALEEFSTLPPAHPDAIPDVEGKGSYDFSIDGIPDGKGGYVEVKEGDRIQFYVEVFAKADPEANPGHSAIREKEVVSYEEFRKWIAAKDDLKERTRLLEEQQRSIKVED